MRQKAGWKFVSLHKTFPRDAPAEPTPGRKNTAEQNAPRGRFPVPGALWGLPFFDFSGDYFRVSRIVPAPTTLSPSYSAAVCPGVTARWGSSNSTSTVPSGSGSAAADCGG